MQTENSISGWSTPNILSYSKEFFTVLESSATVRVELLKGKGGMTAVTVNRTEIDDLVRRYKLPEAAYVTRPIMPDLRGYTQMLQGVWDRKWLTNQGPLHEALE